MIFIAVMLGMMAVIWWLKYPVITKNVVSWKWIESWPIQFLPYGEALRQNMIRLVMPLNDATFLKLMAGVYPLSLFWTPLVIWYCVRKSRQAKQHPTNLMFRKHTVDTLLEAHAKNFSAIAPVMDRNLLLEDPEEWKSPLDPGERARQLGLIVREKDSETGERRLTFNRRKARQVLVEDLGQQHQNDPRTWTPTQKVMFSILAEAAFNMDEGRGAPQGWLNSQALRDQLNYSARNKRHLPNYALANDLFKKWVEQVGKNEHLTLLLKRHSYVSSFLYALYMETTDLATISNLNKGVLQSADFIWLKPNDRPTFFYLNTVGRKTPFVESCAVFAQYQAEMVAYKNKLILPVEHIDKALEAWEEDLKATGVVDEDAIEDFS